MCFNFFKKKRKTSYEQPWQTEVQLPDMQIYNNTYNQQEPEYSQQPSVERQSEIEHKSNNNKYSEYIVPEYKFWLTVFGVDNDKGFEEIYDPTEKDLRKAVEIIKTEKEFFTIISYDPINSFTLLSASMEYGEDWYTATIQHEAGERNGKRIEKSYDKKMNDDELIKLVTDFINYRTPDITDGSWIFNEVIEFDD